MMKYLKNNYPEIIIFVLFCIGTITISSFHEPWFDEFQAWGISKDSIYNILFVIPHLEGHPPLWHLVLKCFSYFNVNCEFGLKIPNLLFMFAAVWLLIFKSPFPLIVRITLPFTYFIFYQYSIVNRCYSIFSFAIFLAALFYKDKDEHPYRFVFALALLCLSCAYGMVLAVGIIIVWAIELIKSNKILYKENIEKADNNNQVSSKTCSGFIYYVRNCNIILFLKNFIKDKRFFAMFLIFLLCLYLTFILIPDENGSMRSWIAHCSVLIRIIYLIFVLPSDALISDLSNYFYNNNSTFNFNIIIQYCILGMLVNIFFFCVFRYYKKLLLFFIPYFMFLCFASIYIYLNNIGLLTLFYIFVFWCAISEGLNSKNQIPSGGGKRKIICFFITFMVFITIAVQLYWCYQASVNEIKYPLGVGRDAAKFIKENNLDNYKIKIYNDIFISSDYWFCIDVIPYFNKNIFYNFNINYLGKQYFMFKFISEEEQVEINKKIAQVGFADLIINPDENDDKVRNNYMFLKVFSGGHLWKDKTNLLHCHNYSIFIRKDLYKRLFSNEIEKQIVEN